MLLKRSDVPQVSTGRNITVAMVRIRENGQVAFNKFASEKLITSAGIEANAVKEIFLDFDEATRKLGFSLKVPKGAKPGDGFPAQMKKTKEKESKTKVYEQLQFSGAGAFRHIKYDYVASGSQVFSAVQENGKIEITIPEGALTPVEKKARKPRKSKDSTLEASGKEALAPEAELALV